MSDDSCGSEAPNDTVTTPVNSSHALFIDKAELPAGLVHGVEATHWYLDSEAAQQLPYYRCEL